MADDPQTSGGSTGLQTDDKIVIDKNKSPEQYIKEAEVHYIVPRLVRETFPDLVKLIYETESMNSDEREYWMQILPIMTEEQIKKFRDILVNEKNQLSKLDKEYKQEMNKMNTKQVEFDEEKMKEKMHKLNKEETAHEKEEKNAEADLLKKLQGL